MINFFLAKKLIGIQSSNPSVSDIDASKRILFSIFTRYGDTIINLTVIKEFISVYPKKKYLVLCPRQMKPYVEHFLPGIECIPINKRNLIDMYKAIKLLKKTKFDIGFNPWSNGLDSSFFISYCDKFIFYKDFKKPEFINHYEVVRKYLRLPEKEWSIQNLIFKDNYQKILICPQSTDLKRSFSGLNLDSLINDYQIIYNEPKITVASMNTADFRDGTESFLLKKTARSSKQFLDLIKTSALVVCADSGPLHIALALNKDLIVFMKSTLPEIVINTGSVLSIKKF